jgi:hypothetical protein
MLEDKAKCFRERRFLLEQKRCEDMLIRVALATKSGESMKHFVMLALSALSVTAACSNTAIIAEVQDQPVQLATHLSYEGAGEVIAHIPKADRNYVGSPSIVVMPNGNYLASHDIFGPNSAGRTADGRGKTRLYKSKDGGETWSFHSEIEGQFMSNLFVHNSKVFIMGVNKSGGDLVIRQWLAKELKWTTPDATVAKSGFLKAGRFHTAPTPIIRFKGRLWRAVEDQEGADKKTWPKMFRAVMVSAPFVTDGKETNLLDPDSWTFSNPMEYNEAYLAGSRGWLEGNAVAGPSDTMFNILRVHTFDTKNERIAVIKVKNYGEDATFDPKTGFSLFPGGGKKFTIRYDSLSKKYWSLANYVPEEFKVPDENGVGVPLDKIRNTLALVSSDDLTTWTVNSIVAQYTSTDKEKMKVHGYQYADWQFEGNDIIAVSRTAFEDGVGGADNYHNNNFMTFHRVANFRNLKIEEPVK